MIEQNGMNSNALEIVSRAHTVRLLVKDDVMFFSATDILAACGVKAPTKWIERNARSRPEISVERFDYPVKTPKGYRNVRMLFVTGEAGEAMVKATPCLDETKRWLMEEVLVYRVGGRKQEPEIEPVEEKDISTLVAAAMEKPAASEQKVKDISSRIDSILLELLDIKAEFMRGKNIV